MEKSGEKGRKVENDGNAAVEPRRELPQLDKYFQFFGGEGTSLYRRSNARHHPLTQATAFRRSHKHVDDRAAPDGRPYGDVDHSISGALAVDALNVGITCNYELD
ncbi:hypothetical protein WN48_11018 [Eufriesea mexicana]|uniref:Uncharacterized protein n=1 Tax=Eufriesea mexicana TaxID=516756 RepID=A0A310S618_9HYME|nr:hypothetical protein WN48_11018 [Eufriesea mexicana]